MLAEGFFHIFKRLLVGCYSFLVRVSVWLKFVDRLAQALARHHLSFQLIKENI